MSPRVVSAAEWVAARKELQAAEEEAVRTLEQIASRRREMPAVKIEKDYVFEGPGGKASLLDLFEGRTQLIVQHFMFDPAWEEGCPVCSYQADSVGPLAHLHARKTTYAAVSRAPISKIEPFRQRMGWTFPWYSSHGSDFNYDFHVTHDESVAPIEYNFRTAQELADRGEPWAARPGEQGGVSVFFRDGDTVLAYLVRLRPSHLLAVRDRHPPGPHAAGPPGRDRRVAPPRQVPLVPWPRSATMLPVLARERDPRSSDRRGARIDVTAQLASAQPDVQRVAQGVADQVAGHHDKNDRSTDREDQPPVSVLHELHALGEHVAPVLVRVMQPEAQETENRDREDRVGDVEGWR